MYIAELFQLELTNLLHFHFKFSSESLDPSDVNLRPKGVHHPKQCTQTHIDTHGSNGETGDDFSDVRPITFLNFPCKYRCHSVNFHWCYWFKLHSVITAQKLYGIEILSKHISFGLNQYPMATNMLYDSEYSTLCKMQNTYLCVSCV